MRPSPFFALLLLQAAGASAKCAMPTYVIEGVVKDESADPIESAIVAISWLVHGKTNPPLVDTSDALGHYRIEIPFNTYNRPSMWR